MRDVSNIKQYLEHAETQYGEPIEAIVVGVHYNNRYEDGPANADENIILSREIGLKKLDENYDPGFGGADCYPMYAWSASRVFFHWRVRRIYWACLGAAQSCPRRA
jgi:hypothetical protein